MFKRFAIIAVFILVSNFVYNSRASAVTNATFFVGGISSYTCATTGGSTICTPSAPSGLTCGAGLDYAILHVNVSGQDIPSYCSAAMACDCWNAAYLHSGSQLSVFGKLYPAGGAGTTTLNSVTSITFP